MRLHRILRSLPFEPMALSTFETIERAAASSSAMAPPQGCASHGPPYFISPKHDGVRIVSYVSERAESLRSTCFSRFGRPVHGMFWIEEELRLLRWLCGDPRLALDGELYIHKQSNGRSKGESGAKTGFLAVAALVHRLRGPKSACSTEEEVLNYVDSLPRFCIFDIVSYQPSESLSVAGENSGRGLSQIEKERVLLLREVMKANEVCNLEMLRVIPNYSVFSQRLKAMNFLMCLLQRVRASPILFPGKFAQQSHERGEQKRSESLVGATGVGGEYVQLIQYSMLRSLQDAKRVYLKNYVSNGYEGAVVRSAANVYEVREKEKGILLGLLDPLLDSDKRLDITATASRGLKRGLQRTAAPSPPPLLLLHTYANDEPVIPAIGGGVADAAEIRQCEAEESNHQEVVRVAVRRTKQNPRRSTTVVKLLPFCDKEYAILKPLLKVPSTNPRARKLISIPLSSFKGGHSVVSTPRTRHGRDASKENDKSKVVVFYGLQCLSETGRVFNVPLPKMDVAKQRLLLDHLLDVTGASNKKGKSGPRRVCRRSLTGLYATVKYATLTEYGIPRFGQVKAIRGGKGWFM
ncbi:putative DNA ligase [Trypanosoma grayi]|uniref:putative DNA ligase n=1 Tax=Trypanosoma grayi TaxID=71804 RepID=UPI0004F482A1|nr:putative DNA ligase [Trypanosoma grayi]KEG13690.1 putative DNA ligase [Trypanosoma grayi]